MKVEAKRVVVVGSGFSGLVSALELRQQGHDVTIYEKAAAPGGRANRFHDGPYHFDNGPSW